LKKYSLQESPIIKKELALTMKDLCNVIDDDLFGEILSLLIKDSNDSVRIHIIESVIALKSHPLLENFSDFISNVVNKLGNDESWRVRLTLCDKIHEILNFPYIKQSTRNLSLEIYAKMFDDTEAEIRNICCLRLESIAETLGKQDIFDIVLSQLKKIEKDQINYVRGALASTIIRICPLIGKSKTSDYVFPVFLNLIKDESHEIRLTLIKSLDRLNEVLNIDVFLPTLIPSLVEIASNKSWRVRIQIMESVPVMARIMVKQ
jgi:serine/threonine-protein phosphatase 2A regulatory subunit A